MSLDVSHRPSQCHARPRIKSGDGPGHMPGSIPGLDPGTGMTARVDIDRAKTLALL